MFDKENMCPLFRKPCIEHKCKWFVKLQGTHPQSGDFIDEWNCAVPWLVILSIEGTKETKAVAEYIESFRNEAVRQNEELLGHIRERQAVLQRPHMKEVN